jgi:ABC-type multidrug transport system fused ATPase/permease subunit
MRPGEPRLAPFALLRWAFSPSPLELARLVLTLLAVWACELATPFLLGKTVDAAVSGRRAADAILQYGGIAFAVMLILYVVHAAYLRDEARIVARAGFDLRRHVYARLLAQPLAWFSSEKTAALAQQVMLDCEIIDEHGIYLFAEVPFAVLTVLGIFAVMLWTQATLAMLLLLTLSAAAVLSHYAGRPLGASETARKHHRFLLGAGLHEIFSSFRAVKLFGRERFEMERLDAVNGALAGAENGAGRIFARLEPLLDLIKTAGFLVIVWYGAWLVLAGALTPGRLVAFIAYTEIVSEPIQGMGRYFRHYVLTRNTLRGLCDLLAGLSWPAPEAGRAMAGPLSVDLRDIRFAYPDGDCNVLDGVSMAAAPGEIVAVVGRNGAGKSTLMDIILGLRDADSGAVRIGGVAVEEWDSRALRAATAAVPQTAELFHGTLAQNIAFGAPEADAGDMDAAIEAAGLDDLIARLPNGAQTIVGERGAGLSGGERQRVALARALIRKPAILVLDEPGTGLDPQALAAMGRALREGRAERTTFIVAHDPAHVLRPRPAVDSEPRAPAGSIAGDAIHAPLRFRPSRLGPQPCSTP